MRLVTSEKMREIDRHCIEDLGIPGLKLMESAGVGTARFIEREISPVKGMTVTVVCGKGNNGGDGFVIARELKRMGASVNVYLAGHREDVSGDARTNLDRLGAENIIELSDGKSIAEFVTTMTRSDLVVDAVFGTGFSGVPRGLSGTVIGQMDACGRPVLAVDVPSGLNATTGAVEGDCVHARWTCTMALSKRGLFVGSGRGHAGLVHVVDIGVPRHAIDAADIRDNVLTAAEAVALVPKRPIAGHKGTFGKVVVIAGSVGYSGAAALTSRAALRAGAGLVYLGTPVSLNDVMETKLTEVITRPLAETAARSLSSDAVEDIREMLEGASSLALGPGVSRNPETQALMRDVVAELTLPCVIDADGLNALTPELIGERAGDRPVVLTPHPGEMSRLSGRAVRDVLVDRDAVARDVAARARAAVVLKGASSVVADSDGSLYINPTGNNGMASGGTGDVLTGVIAAFLARGMMALEAAALGAYVHGLAADLAAETLGETSMIAGDVLEHMPGAFLELKGDAA
jgi:hydroxyethylthiazole kinase-like uncharacterized protein yjeF